MPKQPRKPSVANSRLWGYQPLYDRLLFGLALLGVLITVHLIIQQGRGFDRGCLGFSAPNATEATFDCNAVVHSEAGKLFGVSNAYWGLAYYLVLSVLGAVVAFSTAVKQLRVKQIRALFIVFGFLYSLYLLSYQYFRIEEFCALCLASAATAAVLFIIQMIVFMRKPEVAHEISTRANSRREAPLFASLAILVLVLVGADTIYFKNLESPQQPIAAVSAPGAEAVQLTGAECRYDPEKGPYENYNELVGFGDPVEGNLQSPVTVIEVFEPNCPHCKALYPVMREAAEKYGKQAKFYFKPVVFWQQSVTQVLALQAATQEGKFFDMMERQFELQNPKGLNLEQLEQIATQIGMNGEAMGARIQSGMYNKVVADQRAKIMEGFGITSVPMVIINGHVVDSDSRTLDCLGQLITAAAKS